MRRSDQLYLAGAIASILGTGVLIWQLNKPPAEAAVDPPVEVPPIEHTTELEHTTSETPAHSTINIPAEAESHPKDGQCITWGEVKTVRIHQHRNPLEFYDILVLREPLDD